MTGHRVVLRPRSFFEIADLSLVFMRESARPFLRLMPWVLVPAAFCWWLHRWSGWNSIGALWIELLLLNLVQGLFTQLCGELMLVPDVRVRGLKWKFLKRLPAWLWAWTLAWLAALLVFPYHAVVFMPEGVFLEQGRISAIMSRHSQLVRVTPGRAMALGFFTILAWFAGAAGMELLRLTMHELFAIPIPLSSEEWAHLSWAPYLGLALVQPYIATLRFLLYIDCRTRREGWDLQREFAALAAPEPRTQELAA